MTSSNGGVPPGFRFHPTDEELLHYYLKKKITFEKFDMEVIREVDLNKMEPWELQEKCKIGSTPQNEWYFFSHKDRKYPTGSRTNRATNAGFWKATGRDKCIRTTYKKIGMRKTLVFYRGRAPHGQKTDWIMHEYRLEDGDDPQGNGTEDGWVVCRVFKKKNLFKVGSHGGTSMNSSDQHINNASGSMQARNFMQIDNTSYLLRQHSTNHDNQTSAFELNKPDLVLHYPHIQQPQYSLFHQHNSLMQGHKPLGYDYQSLPPPPSDNSPIMAKQLMTSNPRDCESGSHDYQACEPGLEVGTCEPTQQIRDHNEGMNEWAMLDRLVTSHLGNEDSSKGVRFEDANATSANQINHLSSRGEMDFWGYAK